MIKIFITYYFLSGGLTMFYVQKKYDDMVKTLPILEMISKELVLLIQFLFGFLIFPIAFPLHLRGIYLSLLVKRQEFRNRELKSTNELLDFLHTHKEKCIVDAKETFHEEGILSLITFVFTMKHEILVFPISPETEEQYDRMISLIQGNCKQCNGVAVMTTGEAIEKIYDENGNITGEKDIVLIVYEIKGKSQMIKMDVDREKKELINMRVETGNDLVFSDYLEQIYKRK